MNYLLSSWPHISKKLKKRFLLVCLDYDGTLTPIVSRPWDVKKLSNLDEQILKRLTSSSNIQTVLVSGRELSDLKKRVRLENLIYVGNHGFEINGAATAFVYPKASQYRKLMREISGKLKAALGSIPGIIVEDKKFTISVHFRLATPSNTEKAFAIFLSILAHYLKKIRIKEGKKVWEVRPNLNWDKGEAVRWLMKKAGKPKSEVFPIYIGDDHTDEDAFKVVGSIGLAVKVTDNPHVTLSKAAYYLNSHKEVLYFLKLLLKYVKGTHERRA